MKPVRDRNAIRLIESTVAPLCCNSQHEGSEGSYSASDSASAQDSRETHADLPGYKGDKCFIDLAHDCSNRTGLKLLGCSRFRCNDINA